ncbi:MAG: RHS repeat-associated core domain-containing protein [Gemmatimonadota bacterium]
MATRFALVLLVSLFSALRPNAPTEVSVEGAVALAAGDSGEAAEAEFAANDLAAISVTPDLEPIEAAGATTGAVTFEVFVLEPTTASYDVTCTPSGEITSCTPDITELEGGLLPQPEPIATITVTYTTGADGTGQILLKAKEQACIKGCDQDTGSYEVTVGSPQGPLTVDASMNPTTLIERSACVTSGAGPAGAFQCGNLLLTHSMPAYRTRDRDRTMTLLYNSATASPHPVFMGEVVLPQSLTMPDSFTVTVTVGLHVTTRGFSPAGLGLSPRRFAVDVDAGPNGAELSTGVHAYTLEVRSYYGTEPETSPAINSEFVVVNRRTSPYGRGFWIAGTGELHKNQRSNAILVVEADGSAAVYEEEAPDLWVAPAGAFRDTIAWDQVPHPITGSPDSLHERRLQDGTKIFYNGEGQQIAVTDRVGTKVEYAHAGATTGSGLAHVRIAPHAQNLKYVFAYGTHGLDYIDDPAGRRLDVTVNKDTLLTGIVPVGLSAGEAVALGYETGGTRRLTSWRSPRGHTTDYDYHGASELLETVTLPVVQAGEAVTTYKPIQSRGLALATSANTTANALQTTIVIDGPRTTVGDSAVFWVNRLGAPTKIRNPVGNETTLVYDATHPLLVTEIDEPDGTQIRQRWDGSARLEMTKDLDNLAGKDSVHYDYDDPDAPDKPSRIIMPRGDVPAADVTLFNYNPDGTLESVTAPDLHVSRFTYEQGQVKTATEEGVDVYDRATNTTSAQNLTTTLEYDAKRNLKRTISPTNDTTEIKSRDGYGNITEALSPEGRRQTFQYDIRNRRTHVEQWEGLTKFTTITAYDASDNATKVTDPRGLDREWEFDKIEQDTLMRDSRLLITLKRYDLAGNLVWTKDRQRDTITTQYDAMNRPLKQIIGELTIQADERGIDYACTSCMDGTVIAQGDTIDWQYDSGGRIRVAENRTSRVERTFNSRGLMTREVQTLGAWAASASYTQDYTYDLAGNRMTWTWPYLAGQTQHTVSYQYGPGNALDSVKVTDPFTAADRSARFVFDGLGRRQSVTFDSGSDTDFHYDALGRLGRVHSTHPSQTQDPIDQRYTFDRDGNMIREEEHGERRGDPAFQGPDVTSRVFNERGQTKLDSATVAGQFTVARYYYDAAGNRTGVGGTDSTVHTVFTNSNATHEIRDEQGVPEKRYGYDRNGNETFDQDNPNFTTIGFARYYNGLGQLIGTEPDHNWFRYDALGRRVGIRNDFSGSSATRVLFDGNNIVYQGTETSGTRFVHGPGTDDPLFMIPPTSAHSCVNSAEYYYVTHGGRLFDFQNRNGVDCTDGSWGPIFENSGRLSGATAASRSFGASRGLDPSNPDSRELSFFRNRYYNATTGKFTQEDPIGLAGGINLYNYSGNNPAGFTDPFGLCIPWPDCALQEVANRGARRGGFVGGVMLNGAAAANGILEAVGVNDLLGSASERDAGGFAIAAIGVFPAGRVGGTLARVGSKLDNLIPITNRLHLSGAAAELRGVVTGFDHVREVRNAMRGLRRQISRLEGVLGNPHLSDEQREVAERLLGSASKALDRASEVFR